MAESEEYLVIKYDGRRAAEGALPLNEYATSLAGWLSLIDVATQLILRSNPATSHVKTRQFIRVEVRDEREGSWETIVWITQELAPNAAWDALKVAGGWSIVKLIRWCAKVARKQADAKRISYDVDKIVAALESMAKEEGIILDPPPSADKQLLLPQIVEPYELAEPDTESLPDVPKRRSLVDTIDKALKAAALPIGSSCDSIELVTGFSDTPILRFDVDDKLAIDAPLFLAPTELSWRQAAIKFVRINRKTGRALFYFADDPKAEDNAHYSLISDAIVHIAENPYTDAFNRDVPLTVHLRHTAGENGTIRTTWEISLLTPEGELY